MHAAFAESEFGNPLYFDVVSIELMYTEKMKLQGCLQLSTKKMKKKQFCA